MSYYYGDPGHNNYSCEDADDGNHGNSDYKYDYEYESYSDPYELDHNEPNNCRYKYEVPQHEVAGEEHSHRKHEGDKGIYDVAVLPSVSPTLDSIMIP